MAVSGNYEQFRGGLVPGPEAVDQAAAYIGISASS